jgi:hypothetical protein
VKKRISSRKSSNTLARNFWNSCRPWVAAALVTGGMFQLAAPVLADGTAAGTTISNTATGTYEDSTTPGTTINTESNTVTITVAEVAGITLTAKQITGGSGTGGAARANDNLKYIFEATNTGNDATKFFIPGTATVSGPGALATTNTVEYSTDNGTTYTAVPSGGVQTSSLLPGAKVLIRVSVTVNSNASGTTPIGVTLGDTAAHGAGNDQNQPADGQTAATSEVRTVDNTTATSGEANPAVAPANGEREASASQSATLETVAASVLNGTVLAGVNHPDAVGPTDNNDDFTNGSAVVPPGTPNGGTFDPSAKTFTNSVQNNTIATEVISLLPTPPANTGDLPNGTLVTITNSAGTQSATYIYNSATGFTFQSGTGGTSATVPVTATVNPNTTITYTTTVDLPANTAQLTAFPVPITAYVDSDGTPGLSAGDAKNITIDRVYTGFLSLLKESRVLIGTGPAVTGTDGTFSTTTKTPAPGNIVEYQITYKNISTVAPTNAGAQYNVTLNASTSNNTKGPVITENGTLNTATYPATPNGNSWGQDYDGNGTIDTSHSGTATDTGGTITYFSGLTGGTSTAAQTGTTPTTDVTKYVDTVNAPVGPQQTGTFTIQRKIN